MSARGALASFLDATLRIRPGEGRRTALLFLHLLLASAVFFLGRTVRDTLFLSRYGLGALPWMFVAYGVASAATVLAYSRIAASTATGRLIGVTCAFGIASYLAVWLAVRAELGFVYPFFYVWSEIVSALFLTQFWTLANELHDVRSAKRLFGTIGSARLLASVLVGLATGAIVAAIGTPQLIVVVAVLMGAAAVVARHAGRAERVEQSGRPTSRPERRGAEAPLLADGYVRLLALLLLLAFTAVNIGDFQFKAIARATYREDDLARFFSLFYAGTGIIAFLFQVFVTPRILSRLGVAWGMTVMPAGFGIASVLLRLLPGLPAATLMKFADNGAQFTIHETSLQALYAPFPAALKARARAFLDSVVRPAGFALAGLTVILLRGPFEGAPERFALVTIPLVAAWLLLIPAVKRRYQRQLEATLTAGGILAHDGEYVLGSEGRRALVRVLETGTSRQRLVALEQLAGERDPLVAAAVDDLARHDDPVVRAAALMHAAHTGSGDPVVARGALADESPEVRAAAAAALAAAARDEAVEDLAPLLADPEADVRVAALVGLLREGGVEGGIVGGAELGRLLAAGGRDDLVNAARALRHLGPGAYRPLRRLLADPDPSVRRAAARAAPGVADPRLVPVLIGMLSDRASRHRAGQALVAIGEAATEPLAALLGDAAVSRAVQLEVPRLLRRVARPVSYNLLRRHVATADSHVRLRVLAGLSHLRTQLNRAPEPLGSVAALIRAEIAESDANVSNWTRARERFSTPLMEEEFTLRRSRAVRRLLRILELRYDPDSLHLVRSHIGDAARRANALEVLDTMLDAALRPVVMPFVDPDPGPGRVLPPAADPVTFMILQCRHPNPWVVALALDALARAGEQRARTEAEALATHADELVREAAHAALSTLSGKPGGEVTMYSTIEKVLFLKSAPVFERVSGEDLAPLARVAEVESWEAGNTILRRGDPGDALYVITRGTVTIGDDGRTIATLGAGDTIGEMAVLDNEPRVASATAAEEVEVLRIDSEAFYEVLHEQVEIAEGVIRMLCSRLRETDRRFLETGG
jgi:ATP/ADP translocase/HEAT repeat protein